MESHINALTIDVEDAVNQAMRNYFHNDMNPTIRVSDNTMRLLDLFSGYNCIATFFILGEVAKTFPELIREIARRGHELGIHGYSHTRYYNLSKEKARDEIVSSIKLVEDISGMKVIGHRAPEFSINQKTLWVFEILYEAGIQYDSSVFPANSGRYGWPGFNKNISFYDLDNGRRIIEAPLSVVNFIGKEFPTCGGGYLRAFPYRFTEYSFNTILKKRPVILYMHPYEIDPPPFQEFYMQAMRKSSLRIQIQLKKYWFNRNSVIPKLRKLLGSYKFTSLQNVINNTLDLKLPG